MNTTKDKGPTLIRRSHFASSHDGSRHYVELLLMSQFDQWFDDALDHLDDPGEAAIDRAIGGTENPNNDGSINTGEAVGPGEAEAEAPGEAEGPGEAVVSGAMNSGISELAGQGQGGAEDSASVGIEWDDEDPHGFLRRAEAEEQERVENQARREAEARAPHHVAERRPLWPQGPLIRFQRAWDQETVREALRAVTARNFRVVTVYCHRHCDYGLSKSHAVAQIEKYRQQNDQYYIGATTREPVDRFLLDCDNAHHSRYRQMIVLVRANSAAIIAELETDLINYYRGKTGCQNIAPGGRGFSKHREVGYLYLCVGSLSGSGSSGSKRKRKHDTI